MLQLGKDSLITMYRKRYSNFVKGQLVFLENIKWLGWCSPVWFLITSSILIIFVVENRRAKGNFLCKKKNRPWRFRFQVAPTVVCLNVFLPSFTFMVSHWNFNSCSLQYMHEYCSSYDLSVVSEKGRQHTNLTPTPHNHNKDLEIFGHKDPRVLSGHVTTHTKLYPLASPMAKVTPVSSTMRCNFCYQKTARCHSPFEPYS